MSGANSQPWEFILVRSPDTIAALYAAYQEHMNELNYWLEQRFPYELRHPGFRLQGDPDEQLAQLRERPGWLAAPAVIAVLGDGRRQLGSVSGASTPGRNQTHLTDALSNAGTYIHLAAAALGFAAQWVSIHVQELFKQILNVPPRLTLHTIIPVGYPQRALSGIFRRQLKEIVHHETYERDTFMTTRHVVEYLYRLRAGTIRTHARHARPGLRRRATGRHAARRRSGDDAPDGRAARCGLDRYGDLTYFSNCTVKLPVAALMVVPLEAGPVLFLQGASRGLPAAKATTWVADVRACADTGAACAALLTERPWPVSRIGLAGVRALMPAGERRGLLEALDGLAVLEIDDVADAQWAVKAPCEIDQMRRADRIRPAMASVSPRRSRRCSTRRAARRYARRCAWWSVAPAWTSGGP